jgi:hypothetical protein
VTLISKATKVASRESSITAKITSTEYLPVQKPEIFYICKVKEFYVSLRDVAVLVFEPLKSQVVL